MERKVELWKANIPTLPQKKKVAAYARVSSGKDKMLHSLSAQVSYYKNLIIHNPKWQYQGVYADEAISGTKNNRENFLRLIDDCKKGKIDMIITKSISRFARNTVTLLQTVRELKDYFVDVYFEEQNIHTMSADGELILTILASYAQEESLSVSENQRWRVKHNFENGMPWNGTMLGYRYKDGVLEVEDNEAEVVKYIFDSYISGTGFEKIANTLNSKGVLTRRGKSFCKTSIKRILTNYAYTGNLLLQQTYCEDNLTKIRVQNNGELPKYHIENSHQGIIPLSQYETAQELMKQKTKNHKSTGKKKATYPFTGLIECGCCHKHYRRKVTATRVVWICTTYNLKGKAYCESKAIAEDVLIKLTQELIGDISDIKDKITLITVIDDVLIFRFKDGTQVEKQIKE